MSPQKGTILKRSGESKIAGLNCIDWSWMDDTELHTACLTPDGVLLRLVIDGQTVAEARTVLFAPQPSELFEVPPGYEPATGAGRWSGGVGGRPSRTSAGAFHCSPSIDTTRRVGLSAYGPTPGPCMTTNLAPPEPQPLWLGLFI